MCTASPESVAKGGQGLDTLNSMQTNFHLNINMSLVLKLDTIDCLMSLSSLSMREADKEARVYDVSVVATALPLLVVLCLVIADDVLAPDRDRRYPEHDAHDIRQLRHASRRQAIRGLKRLRLVI